MAKRATPEINAGSMADIAFLLLIFFLVTTTMDTDKGINQKLPPWQPEELEDAPPPIKKKNIFTVLINANDQLLVNGEIRRVDEVREEAIEFIDNNGDGSCEWCEGSANPELSDNPNKAIVSLQNDRGTTYSTYITVLNELRGAYHDLRDRLAEQRYGVKYHDLKDEDQIKEIKTAFPQKISEAEPVDLSN